MNAMTYLPRIRVAKVGAYWWITEGRIPRLRFESWESAMVGAHAWDAKRLNPED